MRIFFQAVQFNRLYVSKTFGIILLPYARHVVVLSFSFFYCESLAWASVATLWTI